MTNFLHSVSEENCWWMYLLFPVWLLKYIPKYILTLWNQNVKVYEWAVFWDIMCSFEPALFAFRHVSFPLPSRCLLCPEPVYLANNFYSTNKFLTYGRACSLTYAKQRPNSMCDF